jgi:hypothetical protein
MFVNKFSAAIIIMGLVLFILLGGANIVRAEQANSMWLEPSAVNFGYASDTSYNATAGTKFNVTAWAYIASSASFCWQVTILFNPFQVQVVAVGYTAGTTSQFFAGHTTVTVSPLVDNVAGKVVFGESLLDSDSMAADTTNSLMWVEFEVVSIPNATTVSLRSTFSLGNISTTFFLDPNLNVIPTTNVGATYSFYYEGTPAPLTVNSVTQSLTIVYSDESVTVDSNVTGGVGGVENVTLSYFTNNTAFANVTIMLNSAPDMYVGTIPGESAGTTVYYFVTAYDSQGNEAMNNNAGANWSYVVIPRPLTINWVTRAPLMVHSGQSVTVWSNVTGGVGEVENVTLSYSTNNVTFINVTMALNSVLGMYVGTIPGESAGTTVYYFVTAYDTQGNEVTNNNAGANWSYVVAALPLTIGWVMQTPAIAFGGDSVTVSANVTGGVGGVANVTLSYSADNATFTNFTMTLNSTTGMWEGIIPGYSAGTIVYYLVAAQDFQGNSTEMPSSYVVSAPLVIGTPQVVLYNYNLVNGTGNVTVLAQLTNEFGVANVSLSYSANNVTFINVTMALNSVLGMYVGTIPQESVGTKLYYFVTAYDSQGNEAMSNNAGANWSYTVIPEVNSVPEFNSLVVLMVVLLAVSIAVLLTRKKVSHK